MSLFDNFDAFYMDVLHELESDVKAVNQGTNNKEVPTEVDNNGKPKPAPNQPTAPGTMVIQSKCPIAISSTTENDVSKVVVQAYIRGMVDDLDGYIPLLDILHQADENTEIYIHIQSGGGMVTTGSTIASAIARCRGRVVTIAEGLCASAASLIWSAGHECRVYDYAIFMYHMSSHADMNNSLYIAEAATRMVRYVQNCLMRSALAKGHITKEEHEIFCEQKQEVWISAEEMKKRLAAKSSEVDNG